MADKVLATLPAMVRPLVEAQLLPHRRRRRFDPLRTFFQRRSGSIGRKSQEAMNHSGVP